MQRLLYSFILLALLLVPRVGHAQIPLGQTVATYDFAPSKLLADPVRPRVYATVPADNSVRVIYTDTLGSDQTIPLPVGSIPVDLAISPDGSQLYVANSGTTVNAISVFDLNTLTLLMNISLPGPGLGVAAAGNNAIFVLSRVTTLEPQPKGPALPVVTTPIFKVDASAGTVQSTLGEDQEATGVDNVTHNYVQVSPDGQTLLVVGSVGLEEFDVASGDLTHIDPTIGKTAVQLLLSSSGKYLAAPDPAGNGDGVPLTTLLFNPADVEEYYGTFSDPAMPGPLTFTNDEATVYQLRFVSGGGEELLLFKTDTFLETGNFVLPANDLTFSAVGRNTIVLDNTGAYLFIGGATTTNTNSPGQLLVVATGVLTPPVITSTLTVNGTEGTPLSYQITAMNMPDSFDATGLPAGLTVDTAAGLITGTPTEQGTFNVTISATNAAGTGSATLVITLGAPGTSLVPAITNPGLPNGVLNQPYSATITATNSPDSYGATGLPPGLTIDPASGIISGVPTVAATYLVTVSATNSYGTGSTTLSLTVVVSAVAPPVITSATSATAQVGTFFTYQTTATGNPTSYGASSLPKGLSIDTATGLISGTPTNVGPYSFVLSATNPGGTGSITLTITTSSLPVPAITSATQAMAATNVPFTYQITASNNPTSYAASGLAPGLTVDPATGLISGTPTAAGTFSVTLNATNGSGTGTAGLFLTVNVSTPIITSAATATAGVGQTFSFVVAAANNPTSFQATDLPPGLTIDPVTGVISGVPTVAGVYPVALSVTNAGGTTMGTLTLTVAASMTTVDLLATTPHVTTGSGDTGAITVSRSGDVTRKLVVHYAIKGSAVNGVDYAALAGKIKLRPGAASATIQIAPKGTLSGDASRTVKLTILPTATYQVGGSRKAKVVILAGDE